MATLTVKINERSNLGKAIAELLRSSAKESKAVEIIEEQESPYNPEFVKMVLKAAKSKRRTRIDSKKLWESI